MKNTVRTLGTVTALAAAMASTAWAFPTYNNTEVCGGNNYYTCVTLTSSYDPGTNTLTLQVANTSTKGDFFTAIGVGNLPAGVTITAAGDDHPADWTLTSEIADLSNPGGGNPGDYTFAGVEKGGSPQDAIGNDGNTYTFTFTFSGAVDPATLALAFRSQSGPEECAGSAKLYVDTDGTVNSGFSELCGPPTTTVPEPITMSLLATGLAGMGGVGAIRRRKKA
ncbi:MAG TPA: PEP-CTERM sorting domain-containing protein [Gemmatimonadales bacterium]|nr:PEP-CTERM sorting domain-containing protein [Gemmatimonadales bacterium]